MVAGRAQRIYPAAPPAIFAQLLVGLRFIGLNIVAADADRGVIRAKTDMSGWSWGEKVTISLQPTAPDQTAVTVESRYKFQISQLSGGTGAPNKRNIRAVFELLDQRLPVAGLQLSPRPPTLP
jgi:hypothetical protein